MKLTTQLVSFITLCVIAAMATVLIGGVFSFRELGMELQQKKVDALVEVIDEQLDVSQNVDVMSNWLPTLLRAAHVVELEVRQNDQRVYWFRDVQRPVDEQLLLSYSHSLPHQAGMQANFRLERPFKEVEYSVWHLHRGVRSLVLHPLVAPAVAGGRVAGDSCPADPG